MPGALATTVHGVVRGTERSGSTAFYGLPYAAPPVGELMFSAPSPPDRWEGVRDASRPGPTAQRRGFDAGTIPEPSLPGDDYLTVNVFTPTTAEPGSDLPVLVYLHGGAYIAGSPVSPWYDGSAFNRDAIVVVTVGYRLGLLGFGSLRGATENRALLDWLAALEWVRDNIHAFGGDPDRVTLAGQSAGGGAVLTLLGTPGISGLVARAIAASPVLSQATTEEARRTADQAAALTGAAANVESLLALPSWTLHDLPWRMPNVFGSAAGRATAMTDPVALVGEILDSIEFCPTTDGNLVVRPIALGARECPIPLLIGATAHELTSTVPALLEPCDLAGLERLGLTADEAEGYVSARDPDAGWGQLLTDLMFRAGVVAVADGRAATWVYDFRERPAGDLDPGRAFHCSDIPFAWDLLGAPGVKRAIGCGSQHLADEVHGAWVAFIRDGDPGWSEVGPAWSTRIFDRRGVSTTAEGYAAERHLADAVEAGPRVTQ